MSEILNYIKINELISTSGQPSIEQFKEIANNEYEVVINLALHNASNAIENEDKIVKLKINFLSFCYIITTYPQYLLIN